MSSLTAVSSVLALVLAGQGAPEGGKPKQEKEPTASEKKHDVALQALREGHPARAEALFTEFVEEAEARGVEDERLAKALTDLGTFQMIKPRDRYAEAEPLLRRALTIREKVNGPNHPETAEALIHLAACWTMAESKRAEEAGPMLRRALEILEKAHPKGDPHIIEALNTLAGWHLKRKEPEESIKYFTRALAIREKAEGPNSLNVAGALDNLATIEMAQSQGFRPGAKPEARARLAESYYARALAIREKALKPDDPAIGKSLLNLGQMEILVVTAFEEKDAAKHAGEAERYFDRWLKWADRAKAPASETHVKVWMMTGMGVMIRKDFDEADRRIAKAQAMDAKINGPHSENAAALASIRTSIALEAKRFDDAQKFLNRELDIQADRFGPDDPEVKEARELMAGGYRAHINDRRAPLLWHQLEERGKEIGRKAPREELGEILKNYARILRKTNRAMPGTTEEDLTYLKRHGIVLKSTDMETLANTTQLIHGEQLDDQGLAHIERLYDLEFLMLKEPNPNIGRRVLKRAGFPSNANKVPPRFTDAGLAHLKNLVNLKDLFLLGARITDAGLKSFEGLESLEQLHLGSTDITDGGLKHLAGLKNLRELSLYDTDVTDAGMDHLKSLKHLKKLDLKGTNVSLTKINELRRALPGLRIELDESAIKAESAP